METPTHQGWNFPLNSPLWLAESLYRESESSSNSHSIFEEVEVYVSKSKQSWIGSKSSIYKSLNSWAIMFDCNKQIRPLSCRKCVGGVVGSLRIMKRLRKSHSLSQTVGYKVLSANSVFSIRYLPPVRHSTLTTFTFLCSSGTEPTAHPCQRTKDNVTLKQTKSTQNNTSPAKGYLL